MHRGGCRPSTTTTSDTLVSSTPWSNAEPALDKREEIMPNTVAALVCASALWFLFTAAANYDVVKRPAGEVWVVTASEKLPSRPTLVRAHLRLQTAAASTGSAK